MGYRNKSVSQDLSHGAEARNDVQQAASPAAINKGVRGPFACDNAQCETSVDDPDSPGDSKSASAAVLPSVGESENGYRDLMRVKAKVL